MRNFHSSVGTWYSSLLSCIVCFLMFNFEFLVYYLEFFLLSPFSFEMGLFLHFQHQCLTGSKSLLTFCNLKWLFTKNRRIMNKYLYVYLHMTLGAFWAQRNLFCNQYRTYNNRNNIFLITVIPAQTIEYFYSHLNCIYCWFLGEHNCPLSDIWSTGRRKKQTC